jgi:nucleotide-binding universal stress UspA family protein
MVAELVVGIDGSPESEVALNWAVVEASGRGYSLRLVNALILPVVSMAYGMAMARPDLEALEEYTAALIDAAEKSVADQSPGLDVTSIHVSGAPAAVLLEQSRSAAGIVVGTRGLGAISGRLLGSVSVRVAGKSACPVFVIPTEWTPEQCAGDPVVVGVDGSPHSNAALRLGLDEAAMRDAVLRIVVAYRIPWLARPVEPELIEAFKSSERAMAAQTAEQALAKVRTEADASTTIEVQIVEGSPEESLIRAAKSASLTVVGARGSGGVRRSLLGSVSRTLLSEAVRPVAIVHVPLVASPGRSGRDH